MLTKLYYVLESPKSFSKMQISGYRNLQFWYSELGVETQEVALQQTAEVIQIWEKLAEE